MSAQANARGIRLMSLAMSAFMANDAIVKTLSTALPVGQLVLVRGLIATTIVVLAGRTRSPHAAMASGRPTWTARTVGLVSLRGFLDALATLAYMTSLFHMPLANAAAINMAAPLFVTLFAAVLLKARVRALGWLATGAGFLGVLLIIQPRPDSFNGWGWLCLAGTVVQASRDLLTQRIPRQVPSQIITLVTAGSVTLSGGLLALAQDMQPLAVRELALMAGAGAFIAIGYHLLIIATRAGDPAVVAPFRYSGLLLALALGWLLWDQVPNALAWVGIVMLLSAGAYLLRTLRSDPTQTEPDQDHPMRAPGRPDR